MWGVHASSSLFQDVENLFVELTGQGDGAMILKKLLLSSTMQAVREHGLASVDWGDALRR